MNFTAKKMLFLALIFFFSFFGSCKNKSLTDKICMDLSGKKPSELIADEAVNDKRVNYLLTLEWDFKNQTYPIAEINTLINAALNDSIGLLTIGGKERYKKLQAEKESNEVLLNK